MAKRRNLKKSINSVCEDLFVNFIASSLYGNDVSTENAEAVLTSIMKLQANSVARVSHVEPGMKPKEYFNDLIRQFNAQAGEVVDHINNM